MKDNLVRELSYEFAIQIVKLCKLLQEQKEFILSAQLMRSGTSVGANVEEASAGQSRRDFVAKMSIASKEARESNYWLRLLRDSNLCPSADPFSLIEQSERLVRILTSIVKTSNSLDNPKPKIKNPKL